MSRSAIRAFCKLFFATWVVPHPNIRNCTPYPIENANGLQSLKTSWKLPVFKKTPVLDPSKPHDTRDGWNLEHTPLNTILLKLAVRLESLMTQPTPNSTGIPVHSQVASMEIHLL